ncbi:pseudouridine synthase [Nocardia sp. NBC_01329]|uniref:pseudouridine synthase n=1 Tax=Nocardia sp. NBC_01329 TaxID=2903594 RepID=UPI002E133685|nr:pseudouridine synthase [Nocardia sp. NBC_01329]
MKTPARRDGIPDRRKSGDQPARAGRGRSASSAGDARRGNTDSSRTGRAGGPRSTERGARSDQVPRSGRAAGSEAPADGRGARPAGDRGGSATAGRSGAGRGGPAGASRGGGPTGGSRGGSAAAGRGGSAGSRTGGRPGGGAAPRKTQTARSGGGSPQLNNAKPARRQHVEPDETGHEKLPWGEGERLQKVLAKAGVASRRAAEEMIEQGRVEVDGIIVREQGLRIDPENAVVRVDGTRVVVRGELVHLALNKPKGWQSTMSDDLGRPCVGDIVAERVSAGQRLFHVGRLDADTEGLLLLTNDGDLAHRLMHPSYEVSKTYLATVQGEVHRPIGKILREGVELDDGPASVDRFQVLEVDAGRSLVKVVLHEGRKHIVRRLLDAVGHPVIRLVRTHIGPVVLNDQRPGTLRVLGRDEIGKLYEAVSL